MNCSNLILSGNCDDLLENRRGEFENIKNKIRFPNNIRYSILTTYSMIKDWKFPDLDFFGSNCEKSAFNLYLKNIVAPSVASKKTKNDYISIIFCTIKTDFNVWLNNGSFNSAADLLKDYEIISEDDCKRTKAEIEKIKHLYQNRIQLSRQVISISTPVSESSSSQSSSSNSLSNYGGGLAQGAPSLSRLSVESLQNSLSDIPEVSVNSPLPINSQSGSDFQLAEIVLNQPDPNNQLCSESGHVSTNYKRRRIEDTEGGIPSETPVLPLGLPPLGEFLGGIQQENPSQSSELPIIIPLPELPILQSPSRPIQDAAAILQISLFDDSTSNSNNDIPSYFKPFNGGFRQFNSENQNNGLNPDGCVIS